MCTGFISLARNHSKPGTFKFIPLQDAGTVFPNDLTNTVIVKTSEGQMIGYSEAVSMVLKHMSLPFRILNKIIAIVPVGIQKRIYNIIATNRYNWFGKHPSCQKIDSN